MHFNLTVKSVKSFGKYKPSSCLVKFLIDGTSLKKEVSKFLTDNGVEVSNFHSETFIEDKQTSLRVENHNGSPEVFHLEKVKIDESFTVDYFRNYFAGLIQKLSSEKVNNVLVELPDYVLVQEVFDSEEYYIRSAVEGMFLGNYTFDVYKTEKKTPEKLEINVLSSDTRKTNRVIKSAQNLLEAVIFARDLVNEPASTLTPDELAKRTKTELTKAGIKVTVLTKRELEKQKFNSILAVGASSKNTPNMIVMNYKPTVKAKAKIVFVGKGVTYDTGGYSIKPTKAMLNMKADMAGGAVVIGLIKAIALNKLPVEVTGVVPAVENMISGSSFKPGDVISTSSGKTIEIMDTDAEGRLILADALEYASKQKPDMIIDFATLTGSSAVALGLFLGAMFTNDDNLAAKLEEAGKKSYERIWRLPMWKEFMGELDSEIADISNLGGRYGGATHAAKFLEYFVDENIRWAHFDIAGPSIKHKLTNYTSKYHTGYGVRLGYEFVKGLL